MSAIPRPAVRGREPELAALDHLLTRLRSGIGGVVIIEGDAGLGKSRLVTEAMDRAVNLSIAVGRGLASPSASVADLAPLLYALFDGPAPLLDRRDLDGRHVSPEQRYWLLQDLQALLERAALAAPLLVCLDDLHWADAGTITALRTLPARLASLPVGWVLATRPDQGPDALQPTLDELASEGAARLVLARLDTPAVSALARELLDAEPEADLLALAEGAEGNPFFLVELFLGLRQEHLLRVERGRAGLVAPRLPDRVRASMAERLARMSESARQVATAAASLGRTFTFADLATMVGQPPATLLTPVDQLMDAGILAEIGDRLMLGHDLMRQAVRAASSRSARRALDRQAADVLLAGGALPAEVAIQLADSAEVGDSRAIDVLGQAAEVLANSDPGTAADLSRRASELAPRDDPRRGRLVAQTTVLLHAAGRVEAAKAFADQQLQGVAPAAEESEVCLSISSMFALSPDVRAGANRRALALPDLPAVDRARHRARLAYNLIQAGRPDEARAVADADGPAADQAVGRDQALHQSGDPTAQSVMSLARAALHYVDGNFARALSDHEAVMRRGFGPGEATRERVAYQWRCELLSVVDRLDDSVQLIASGIADAQRDRQGWALDFFETWQGRQLFQRGRLSDAVAALEGRFDPDRADRVAGALYAAGVEALGRVSIHVEDHRLLRETAAMARAMVADGTPANRGHGAWLLALQAMAGSDAAAAREWAEAGRGSGGPGSILPLYPMDVTDEPHLVRIGLAAGDPDLVAAAVASASVRLQRSPEVASVVGAAAHARGLASGEVDSLVQAVTALARSPRPMALASALEDLGRAQLGLGDRSDGVASLGRALELYAETGATWDAARVRRRLRTQGVRRRLMAAGRPETGWASLTESEAAVARLVAEGLTNREVAERLFVSPHTVNSHLRHAFAKLDINSRVELARQASTAGGGARAARRPSPRPAPA